MTEQLPSDESTNAGGRAASLNTCPGLAASPSSSPDGLDGSSSRPSMECQALGCQRAAADKIIQELRAKNAELEAAVRNFVKGMDEAEQIRELVTKISGNPVNGVSAYVWWCSRYLNVSCFQEARKALQP